MTDNNFFGDQSRRLLAATGSAALLGGIASVGLPVAGAQPDSVLSPDGQAHINDLGACIAGSKSANILLIMDESASLRGPNADEDFTSGPTDPDDIRVAAARDLVQQLSRHADDLDADINVKLAGFGEGYNSDPKIYGDWTPVKGNPDSLASQIDDAADRNNDMWTQYSSALDGADKEFAGAPKVDGQGSDCQAVLFFTDGQPTDSDRSSEQITSDICAPGSSLGALRNTGVRFFTVGLLPSDERDEAKSLLSRMAEGSDCSGAPANGAFFDAGDDPAGLFGAFRNFIPTANSVDNNLSMQEPQTFVLDNSISPVRLSAQPTHTIDGEVTPVLTAPDGTIVELTGDGTETIGDATVTVETTDAVNGMVDAELSLPDGGDWAGEWSFGYDAPTADDARYNVKVQLLPGLSIQVDGLSDGSTNQLRSDDELTVTLVDKDGNTRELEGDAQMTVSFSPSTGDGRIPLGRESVSGGEEATFSLADIDEALTGVLHFAANIVTKGPDGMDGTPLSPITTEFPVSISPMNMPSLGTTGITIDSEETTVDIPVTGPGQVWLSPTTFAAGDDGVSLPAGVSSVEVTSPYSDSGSALVLDKDEQGVLPVTVKTSNLADGRVSITPEIHLVSDDGETEADIATSLKGDMTAPVNKGVFTGVLIGVLLAAILIPLAVLYAMKAYNGRIPGNPGIHALRVPVAVKDNRLVRRDKGGTFTVGFDELVTQTPRTAANGRDVNLTGVPVHVKLGLNPLGAPMAIVDATPSISDEGNQVGDKAWLPLAVHNHWFVTRTPGQAADDVQGDLIIAVDERITGERLDSIVVDIAANGGERLSRLSLDAAPDSGTDGPAGPGGGGPAGPSGPAGPGGPGGQDAPSPFGSSGGAGTQSTPGNSPFGSSPFGGSSPSGPSPFGNSPFGGSGSAPGQAPGDSPFGGQSGQPGQFGQSPFGS